jgi:hypothetical protein
MQRLRLSEPEQNPHMRTHIAIMAVDSLLGHGPRSRVVIGTVSVSCFESLAVERISLSPDSIHPSIVRCLSSRLTFHSTQVHLRHDFGNISQSDMIGVRNACVYCEVKLALIVRRSFALRIKECVLWYNSILRHIISTPTPHRETTQT